MKEEGGAAEGAEPVVEEEGAEGAEGVDEDGLDDDDGDEVRAETPRATSRVASQARGNNKGPGHSRI